MLRRLLPRLLPICVRCVCLTAILLAVSLAGFTAAPASARQLQFLGTAEVGPITDFSGLTFSPDGRHAYVFGQRAAAFRVQETAAGLMLTFLQNLEMPIYGGSDDRQVVVSPDGRTVYIQRFIDFGGSVGGGDLDELLVYRRSVSSGKLTLIEHRGFSSVFALPPDARHVYSRGSQSIYGYAVDQGGRLDWTSDVDLDALTGGTFEFMRSLASSPDGRSLYALGSGASDVLVMERDVDTGAVGLVQLLGGGDALDLEYLSDISFSPDGRYTVSRRSTPSGAESLVVMSRDISSGELDIEGTLFAEPFIEGNDSRQLLWSPDGKYVLVAWELGSYPDYSLGVAVYSFQEDQGLLVPRSTSVLEVDGSGFFGSSPLVFSPNGLRLLLATPGGLQAFAWDAAQGMVDAEEAVEVLDDDIGSLVDRGLAVHPGGEFVYVPHQPALLDQGISIFRRHPSGALTFQEALAEPGTVISRPAFSPDGRHLYTLEPVEDTLAIYSVEDATGRPTRIGELVEGEDGLGLAAGSTTHVSPGGRYVLVGGWRSLALYERDGESGFLEFRDLVGGDEGLALGLCSDCRWAVSPDERFAYQASPAADAVQVFEIESNELVHVQTVSEGSSGLDLEDVDFATLTPDADHLLVGEGAHLHVFARNAQSGLLQHVQTLESQSEIQDVALDSEGRRVLTTLRDGRLLLSLRDPATGRLEAYEEISNEEEDVEGIGRTMAFDPVHGVLYTAGKPGKIGIVRVADSGGEGCPVSVDRLCLGDGRFEVAAQWRDFEGNSGAAKVSAARSDDSGILWFFSENNWEMQIKVLDACSLNDRYWVFAAAATTVEVALTVTDHATGEVRSYLNPLGRPASAITDTDAFSGCDAAWGSGPFRSQAGSSDLASLPAHSPGTSGLAAPSRTTADKTHTVVPPRCGGSPTTACMDSGRFLVEVDWRDSAGNTGPGRVAPATTDDSAMFWFFGPDNWELMVKVLDGCPINGRHWVLSAATTDVEYTLRITDSETGEVREYVNPLGTAAAALADVEAFSTCF